MSQFGTSVINKSGKKLAPKAPQRRKPTTPASSQTSARESVERQGPSHAPQASDTRPPPSSSPCPREIAGTPTQAVPCNDHDPSPKSATSKPKHDLSRTEQRHPATNQRITQAQAAPSPPSETQVLPTPTQRNESSVVASQPDHILPTTFHASPSPLVQNLSVVAAGQGGKRLERSSLEDSTARAQQQLVEDPLTQRNTKRRRLNPTRVQQSSNTTTTRNTARSRPVSTNGSGNNASEIVGSSVAVDSIACSSKRKKKSTTTAKGKTRAKSRVVSAERKAANTTSRNAAKDKDTGERRRRGRRRQVTPENAETVEIAPTLVKMGDLCKDLRTGKKSKREAELQKIDYNKVVREQQERLRLIEEGTLPPPETVDQRLQRAELEQRSRRVAAPQMRMVNGNIVLDENSLRVDRHAQAANEAEPMEEVEENEFTSVFTSGKLSKRKKGESWTEDLTDLFYKGLRMFGTDFGIIANMFPGKTRHQIKLKFCREERQDPQRINETLLGPKELVNMEEFSSMSNTVYEDPVAFNKELEAEAKQHEADRERQRAEMAESLSKRATEAVTEGDGPAEDPSAKEKEAQGPRGAAVAANGKKARKGAPQKKTRGREKILGDEDVEVLGTIEDFEQS